MMYCVNWINLTIFAVLLQNVLGLEGSLKVNYEVRRGHSVLDLDVGRKAKFVKRDNSLEMALENEKMFYLANLEIGSNGDKNGVLVDTGSSDLWVMSDNVDCQYYSSYVKKRKDVTRNLGKNRLQQRSRYFNDACLQYGSFSADKSDTFKADTNASRFYIEYMDNTYSLGTWGTDNIKIGGAEIKNAYFAVANESGSDIAVLGIGPKILENADEEYANFPFALKDQGIINKAAYSVYLNSLDADYGTVLFGGVDKSKYSGPLMKLPIIKYEYDGYELGLQVLVNGIYFSDAKGNINVVGNYSMGTVLDTGSTLSHLPSGIVERISNALGGYYSRQAGGYIVDCKVNSDYEFIFDFNGQKIRVPASSFIIDTVEDFCMLGITERSYSFSLGDNVLRHLYMVVDLEDNEIALAHAAYTDDPENIEIISDSIPDATKVPDYSYTEQLEYITATPSISATSVANPSFTSITDIDSDISASGGVLNRTSGSPNSTKLNKPIEETAKPKSNPGLLSSVSGSATAKSSTASSKSSSELAGSIQPSKLLSAVLALALFF